MGTCAILWAALLAPQQPPALPVLHRELVLVGDPASAPWSDFGLGDGGTKPPDPNGMRWATDAGLVSPGGVRIDCRGAGVKLTFPTGRELLFAGDGWLHLRSEARGGPYPFGAELWLGDGSRLQVRLQPGASPPLRDVALVCDRQAAVPWQRGAPARTATGAGAWASVRLACFGDGGDVFRTIALGPVLVLDRVLVAADREPRVPRQRLAVATTAMQEALLRLPRLHTGTEAALRAAADALRTLAEASAMVLPEGAELPRLESGQLRWGLGGGCELGLDLEAERGPLLQLFAPEATRPLVEWTLADPSAAYLTNPFADTPGALRWHGHGVRLAAVFSQQQARLELHERGLALPVLQRLRR
jgi:hypothetical protein